MKNLFRHFRTSDRERKLRSDLLDLRAELDAAVRVIAVKDVELAELSAVIARNHERVKTETAITLRQAADQEAIVNGRSD